MRTSVAVVIPTLNEADRLPALLESASRQTDPFDEIVVSDGGSKDGTVALAANAKAKVVASPPGRGGQVAAGIDATTAAIVLVLHADARCHPRTVEALRAHFQRVPDSPGGCLGHRFDRRGWLLRLVEWADRRRAMAGASYGDQGQFFRREAVDQIGGYPRLPLMEDLELSRRLQRLGRPAYLDLPVTCSARGFDQLGVLRTSLRNWKLRRAFRRHGERAAELLYHQYYRPPAPETPSKIS